MTDRTISTVTFDTWRGQFQPPRTNVSPFIRAGVSGVGAIKGAAQPQRAEILATVVDTLVNCQTAAGTLEALVGTFVTATDDFGNEYTHTLVESLTCTLALALGDGEAVLSVSAVLWPDDA